MLILLLIIRSFCVLIYSKTFPKLFSEPGVSSHADCEQRSSLVNATIVHCDEITIYLHKNGASSADDDR